MNQKFKERGGKMKNQEKGSQGREIESQSRRTVIKTMVVGASALGAYHVFPTDWSKPIIGQILLPAHAQTSGDGFAGNCSVAGQDIGGGQWQLDISGFITPPRAGVITQMVVTAYPLLPGPPTDFPFVLDPTDASGMYSITLFAIGFSAFDFLITSAEVTGSSSCSFTLPSAPNGGSPENVTPSVSRTR